MELKEEKYPTITMKIMLNPQSIGILDRRTYVKMTRLEKTVKEFGEPAVKRIAEKVRDLAKKYAPLGEWGQIKHGIVVRRTDGPRTEFGPEKPVAVSYTTYVRGVRDKRTQIKNPKWRGFDYSHRQHEGMMPRTSKDKTVTIKGKKVKTKANTIKFKGKKGKSKGEWVTIKPKKTIRGSKAYKYLSRAVNRVNTGYRNDIERELLNDIKI